MIYSKEDIWNYLGKHPVVISTNGYVKKNGEAVMGRGVAKQAKLKFPLIQSVLGESINKHGNHTNIIMMDPMIISFPVKHNWWENADLDLIKRSANELVLLVDLYKMSKVVIPKVGCGNGNLDWSGVEPILKKVFDNRFIIVDKR